MQNTGKHVANLVVAHNFNGEKTTFKNNEDFCKWLINKEHKGYTAIAHNSKGYDAYFILKYCVENAIKPYTIYSGSKLMLLEVPSIKLKIIDSSNFVAGPISAFPKTFGLKEMRKGYFPHYFNTLENQDYVGPLHDVKYYGVDTMKDTKEPDKKSARDIFLDWHTEHKEDVFDFQKEIHAYCNSDVDILRRDCLEFRKCFL
ncbi:unnamed protein product [Psylliodes chrysocephalus]|uniref:DNA-directed DNA polymerase n=1 Tax=Psylliodes chrysocephalus TaxID=3402493 RepID=A0A9P0GEF8_9CUCU|nr:unnamed protein product [Psylliodes chrysocephala]